MDTYASYSFFELVGDTVYIMRLILHSIYEYLIIGLTPITLIFGSLIVAMIILGIYKIL